MSAPLNHTNAAYWHWAEAEFARTGDPMDALRFIRKLVSEGEPLPPGLAAWLIKAFSTYECHELDSMDAAMGLAIKGRGQPRRRAAERNEKEWALIRMCRLCGGGATREQAAVLVASDTSYAVEYLIREYAANRWLTRERGLALFNSSGWPEMNNAEIMRNLLDQYPDRHTKLVKEEVMRAQELPRADS